MLSKFGLSRYYMMKWMDANADGGQGAGGGQSDDGNTDDKSKGRGEGDPQSFATFEAWYSSLDDASKEKAKPAKDHFDRVFGLMRSIREERDNIQTQLKDTMKKLKQGSEEHTTLEELSSQLDKANRRADFLEDAPNHKCINAKAAYAIALADGLYDEKKSTWDWKTIQETAPELFGDAQKRKLPNKRTAGDGSESGKAQGLSMNDWIRSQAGVNTST